MLSEMENAQRETFPGLHNNKNESVKAEADKTTKWRNRRQVQHRECQNSLKREAGMQATALLCRGGKHCRTAQRERSFQQLLNQLKNEWTAPNQAEFPSLSQHVCSRLFHRWGWDRQELVLRTINWHMYSRLLLHSLLLKNKI